MYEPAKPVDRSFVAGDNLWMLWTFPQCMELYTSFICKIFMSANYSHVVLRFEF